MKKSKKVVGRTTSGRSDIGFLGSRIKLDKRPIKMFIELHNGSLVATSIAIVGRREDGDNIFVMRPIEAFHDKLVCAGDKGKTVGMIEILSHIPTKSVASAARRNAPAESVIRIRPQEITHGTFVRRFLKAIERTNGIESQKRWGKSSVETEYLGFNDGSDRQIIEEFCKVFPYICSAIFLETFVIKAIHLCDLT